MGLEFLARVRRTSLWLGGLATLCTLTYQGIVPGASLGAGIVWSLVNLALLQTLVVALTGRDRESTSAAFRLWGSAGAMLLWFGAGGLLLARLSPVWLLGGFLVPFGVIVLKAASLLVVGSSAWRTLMRHPRRTGAAVAALAIAAWVTLVVLPTPQVVAENPAPAAAQAQDAHGDTPADPHAADPHGASAHGDDAHGGGHGEASGPELFPNFITVIYRAFPDAAWAHWLHEWEIVIFGLLIAAIVCVVAGAAAAKRQMVPGRFQNAVELLFKALYDFIVGILGEKHGPKYVPFLGTLFFYILFMNLAGLVPMFHAPTASLNVTVALAITVFVYAQYIGFRELGVVGWLDHLAGSPRSLIGWLMVPLMLPIHVIGEFAKPISLAARLFGNIFGEDMLLVAFASLGVTMLSATGLPFGLPVHLPFIFMAILFSTIQALVFTVLSTIYFLLMLPHDHGHEEGAMGHEAAQHAAH